MNEQQIEHDLIKKLEDLKYTYRPCFPQLFIISNRSDTWYFANNNVPPNLPLRWRGAAVPLRWRGAAPAAGWCRAVSDNDKRNRIIDTNAEHEEIFVPAV